MTRGALVLIFGLGRSLIAEVPRAFAADFASVTRVAIMFRSGRVAGVALVIARALNLFAGRIEGD